MSGSESTGRAPSRARRSWLPVVVALVVVALLAAAFVVFLLVRDDGPDERDARLVVESYLEARVADGCGHLRFHSESLAEEDPSLAECRELEDYEEGEYFEYDVTDVRVDGDRAEVDVEDESDAPSGPFTVHLVVEDGDWRVDEIERHE